MFARYPHPRPLRFGRRRPLATSAAACPAPAPALGEELKLFAVTWLGGFLVASIFFA